jgi:hypothetical protein
MKTKLLTLALAGALALAAAPAIHASAPAEPSPPAETRTARPLPFNGKIYAIDAVAKTFSTQNSEKKIRVYAITPETKLAKKSGPANFEDLKIGEDVRGMATPKGNGHYETGSVIIGHREEPKPSPTLPPPSPTATPTPAKSTPKPSKKSLTPSVRKPTPTD